MELAQIYSVSSGHVKKNKLLIVKKSLPKAIVKNYDTPLGIFHWIIVNHMLQDFMIMTK